jgi:hypothetical protein
LVRAPTLIKRKEVSKGMSGRLPWVAAAVVIVIIAGLGAWALSMPAAPAWATVKLTSTSGPTVGRWFISGPEQDNTSIENVYICDNDALANLSDVSKENENLIEHWTGLVTENYLLDGASDPLITGDDDTATIPYEVPFQVVVAFTAIADADYVGDKAGEHLVAYISQDNVYVYENWSGELVDPDQTSGLDNTHPASTDEDAGQVYPFDNDSDVTTWATGQAGQDGSEGGTVSLPDPLNPTILPGYDGQIDWIRCNAVFTRDGNGFTLPAGGSINIDIKLYGWV